MNFFGVFFWYLMFIQEELCLLLLLLILLIFWLFSLDRERGLRLVFVVEMFVGVRMMSDWQYVEDEEEEEDEGLGELMVMIDDEDGDGEESRERGGFVFEIFVKQEMIVVFVV